MVLATGYWPNELLVRLISTPIECPVSQLSGQSETVLIRSSDEKRGDTYRVDLGVSGDMDGVADDGMVRQVRQRACTMCFTESMTELVHDVLRHVG